MYAAQYIQPYQGMGHDVCC